MHTNSKFFKIYIVLASLQRFVLKDLSLTYSYFSFNMYFNAASDSIQHYLAFKMLLFPPPKWLWCPPLPPDTFLWLWRVSADTAWIVCFLDHKSITMFNQVSCSKKYSLMAQNNLWVYPFGLNFLCTYLADSFYSPLHELVNLINSLYFYYLNFGQDILLHQNYVNMINNFRNSVIASIIGLGT